MKVDFIEKATLQHESELEALVDFVTAQESIKTVLEIGTHEGGTAYVWAQLVGDGGLVVCVDALNGDRVYRKTPVEYRIKEITGKSEDRRTLKRAARALNLSKVDLLFIDGNHSYFGVSTDYNLYSPLVKPGGWIAFHDAFNPAWATRIFWAEIKQKREHWEFVLQRQIPDKKKTIWGVSNPQGIGLIRK